MDLTKIAARVSAAAAEANAPPPPGGSKPFVWPTDLLGEEDWTVLWQVASEVRRHAPETFVRFTEVALVLRIAEELEEDPKLAFASLLTRLAVAAGEHAPRIVSTPICNVVMDRSMISLADDAVLVRGLVDRHARAEDDDVAAMWDAERKLGARLSRPLRIVHLDQPYDTTRVAALLTVEQGATALALARARARTQYAIAMWTVLSPPEGRKVLPDLGLWVPQPLAHVPQRHRSLSPLEGGAPCPAEEGGGFNTYAMFELPVEEDLRLPFQAMSHVDRRGAQAVLSASLQLLAAGRASRLLPSERARALMAAIEALGEQPSGTGARRRFKMLMRRFKTDEAAEGRGLAPADVHAAIDRIGKARNIATHGSDAVLLDLGYPADAVRKMRYGDALGTELAAGSIQSDLPALVHVVGRTLEATVRKLASDGWEDHAYMSYFV